MYNFITFITFEILRGGQTKLLVQIARVRVYVYVDIRIDIRLTKSPDCYSSCIRSCMPSTIFFLILVKVGVLFEAMSSGYDLDEAILAMQEVATGISTVCREIRDVKGKQGELLDTVWALSEGVGNIEKVGLVPSEKKNR